MEEQENIFILLDLEMPGISCCIEFSIANWVPSLFVCFFFFLNPGMVVSYCVTFPVKISEAVGEKLYVWNSIAFIHVIF